MAAATMKRDRLGRFLSPGTARQRGSSGGSCGSGRTRGRPSRTGAASADGAAALAAAQLSWGSTRSCGDTGEDGTDEAGGFRASSGPDVSLVILRINQAFKFRRTRALSDFYCSDFWPDSRFFPALCRCYLVLKI